MHLTQLFDLSFRGRADRVGLEYDDAAGTTRTLTFGDVDARASRMAHELTARGVTRGDRLCVHLANGVEFLDLFLACMRIGVIFVPINILYRERELRHIVTDAAPRAVVVEPGTDAVYPSGTPLWSVADLSAGAGTRESARPSVHLDGDDPALIVYTSGTTGTAKGAVLSHNSLATNAIILTSIWRITESDRYLAMLPLFHLHGLGNGIHSWLISGCRMRLVDRFDHRTTPALMATFKPTLVLGVPTIYVRLLDPAVLSSAHARAIGETRASSSADPRRSRRTCTTRFVSASATRSSNGTG